MKTPLQSQSVNTPSNQPRFLKSWVPLAPPPAILNLMLHTWRLELLATVAFQESLGAKGQEISRERPHSDDAERNVLHVLSNGLIASMRTCGVISTAS